MKNFIVLVALLGLTACSTMQPPRYAVSVDNIQALKQLDGARLKVSSLNQSAKFSPNCRLMGPIEPADGLTFSQFISKALNDEFKMANVYADDGAQLTGDITKIEFSSSAGLTNGYWDIAITLTSSNGKSFEAANLYTFKSGFDAVTACNATADALTPAVQDLIKSTITHPSFKDLLTATAPVQDTYSKLEKLAELRDNGVVTDDEFQTEKTKLLSDSNLE